MVNADRVNFVGDYGSRTTEINFGEKDATVCVAMEVPAGASTLLKEVEPAPQVNHRDFAIAGF